MTRAIVRWSISGEQNNATGLQIRKVLTNAYFARRGTGTWEIDGAPTHHVIDAVQDALELMKNPPGGGNLDHVWIYIDDAENN